MTIQHPLYCHDNTPVHSADMAARPAIGPRRTIRVPDPLWDAAMKKAERRGETISDVVRRALEHYLEEATEAPGAR